MIRFGVVLVVCILVGVITHPIVGLMLFPFGIVRMYR